MYLKALLILAMLWALPAAGLAQSNQYQFSQLDISSGLSHSRVNCIYKDKRGFMWFGTLSGLNRFDGYKFKVYKSNSKDSTSLDDDFILSLSEGPDNKMWIRTQNGFNIYDPGTEKFTRSIMAFNRKAGLPEAEPTWVKKDAKGYFWFVFDSSGVYRYDPEKRVSRHFASGRLGLHSNDITDISFNAKNQAWVVYKDGFFELLDQNQDKVVYNSDLLSKANNGRPVSYMVFADRDGDVWFYTTDKSIGIFFYDARSKKLRPLDKNAKSGLLRSNIVFNILQDQNGIIWVATDHGGINLIDKKTFKITYLLNREDDIKSIAQNSIISLYKDDSGIMWAGTYKKGVSYYHENIIRFPLYRHLASDPLSLSYNDINRFAEDRVGNIWIGTNGGGLIYFNRQNGRYTRYLHDENNHNTIANDVIVSLFVDHDQKVWIGYYWGGLDCFDGHTFTHYRHDDKDSGSISDDRVWDIAEDRDQQLWVGTLAGGLNRMDRKEHRFIHYVSQGGNAISCMYTSAICVDHDDNIWIGGYAGVDVLLHGNRKFRHYVHNSKSENSLLSNYIYTITQDSRNLIWIGTNQGVSVLNPVTGDFINLKKNNGLPDNVVLGILEDRDHHMWLSTSNGLCDIRVSYKNGYHFSFRNFDETDGLQGRDFNKSAAYCTRGGDLMFGGANGFNLFQPGGIHSSSNTDNLVFTDFQVFNNSVTAGEAIDGHQILRHSIVAADHIELNYNENVFAIEFSSLNYFYPDKVSYEYKMEGFNKGWLSADNRIRKATYTNLDPGPYTFKVRVFNPELPGSVKSIELKIDILPPFWRTSSAYVLYILAAVGLLFYLRYRGIKRIKARFELDQERREARRTLEIERQDAQRMHELDLIKIKFFTNVSHEFRTPLSLIIAPVEKMIKNAERPEQSAQLHLIRRNARRLLNMVNQLLDFRKMEVHELKLQYRQGDIVAFIKEISESFTDIAENKHITFQFDSEIERLDTRFDRDKIERILFNLLSNAFKFTQPGGYVSVMLNMAPEQPADKKLSTLQIKVMDTGVGIPEEKLEKIFERFFQNELPGNMLNQGSGIGLSIVKEFVKMHGGEIKVESEPEQGSCFIIYLPVPITESKPKAERSKEAQTYMETEEPPQQDRKKPTVLLVEDNDDFRFYLKDNLKEYFYITEASNGREGWQKALSLHPDLVVSDISMPEMNGIELCQKLKADNRTTHMPVVLLTALSGEAEQLRGLETGATDYMVKPFNFEILLSKLKNILTQQDLMRKTYRKQVDANPSEIVLESPDEQFIQKALNVIDRNIGNTDFSVEELSSEMCVSRVTLYKKILEMTGKSPVELIRNVRLKRSLQLLENGYLTISQVSYKVGFKSQKYFTKSFKEEFNILPSAYMASRLKQNTEK